MALPSSDGHYFDGDGLVRISDQARKTFIDSLNRGYGGFSVSQDEIVKAYKFILGRYQRFVDLMSNGHLSPNTDLPTPERIKIAGIVDRRFSEKIASFLREGDLINL